MAANSPVQAPTIIKRKKVYKGDGHHGGAWKVAYADFVTAMMAFFLLMWLLNATTEEQRKGIADYFNPSIPISRISGGGDDGLNGSSIFSEETYSDKGKGSTQTRTGDPKSKSEERETPPKQSSGENGQIESELENARSILGTHDQALSEHLQIKMSPEGIVLEITDSESTPLFSSGSSYPSETMKQLIAIVADIFGEFGNDIKIVGHTDSTHFRNSAVYDNWNLSADRANAARRLLMQAGVPANRIREVAGKADASPLIADDPGAAQNRRISITILTD